MRIRIPARVALIATVAVMLAGSVAPLRGQEGGPPPDRHVTAPPSTGGSRLTLDLRDAALRDVLKAVADAGGIHLVYATDVIPLSRRVSLQLRDATPEYALRTALRETGVGIEETAPGQFVLVAARRSEARPIPAVATGTLNGLVMDSITNEPVPSASIVVDGGNRQTASDAAGRYYLADLEAGSHLLAVRRIGYAPTTRAVNIPAAGTVTLDIRLVAVVSALEEVVTTVTGPQRRLEVGNVIGAIGADSIVRDAPVATLSDLVSARVPGAQVVLNAGLTGLAPRVRIRGVNSLTVSNDPLLIVDGIRVENSSAAIGTYGHSAGRFNDLDPAEIESIEIVKGPSAATLYGTDAANGVIVVRTKRGHPGRARWNVSAETGLIDEAAPIPDNYYAWGRTSGTGAARQCLLTQIAAGACTVDSISTFNPLRNRITSPFDAGHREQFGVQGSGGVAQFTYFLSGDYENEIGFLRMPDIDRTRVAQERGGVAIPDEQIRPNALRRINVRGNAGLVLGERADMNVSIGIVSAASRIPGNGIFQAGLLGPGYRDLQDGWISFLSRPGESFALRNDENVIHYITSANGNWRPRSWLATRATGGFDYSNSSLDGLQRRGEGPLGSARNGRRLNARTTTALQTADVGASAFFSPLPRLSSRTSIGAQYNRRTQALTSVTGTNLSPGSETVTGAAVITGAEQTTEAVVVGSYAEETIGFAERLFLTAALRADGGSAFGRDFRTALYPKASASWVALTHDGGSVNSVRLRAAYGSSGVQPASTASLALIAVTPALVDGTSVTGARIGAIGNPNLRPERQTEFESGVDGEFFDRRLAVEATYYNRLSRDALINRPLSSEIGLASRQENLGAVRNRGVEGSVTLTAADNQRLTWTITMNGSANQNRLVRIGGGITSIASASPTYQSREGFPLFGEFIRPILGYGDANHNGIIEESEVQVGDSVVYVGSALPPRQATLSTSVSTFGKRLRVATQFDYRGGHKLVNFTEVNRCGTLVSNCRAVNDPRASFADQAAAVAANSTRFGRTPYGFVEDGSFIRWRELSVSWLMPNVALRRLGATSATVTLAARNLQLFTRYSGVDPEVNATPGPSGLEGYNDNLTAPQPRYWVLRVNLGL